MLKDAFGAENIEINPDDRVLSKEELLEKVKGRDGVICLLTDTVDAEVFDAAGPQCKVFSSYAVGVNNIDLKAAAERNIIITNTPGVLTDATADMAAALIFAVARRMVESDNFMRSGKYEGWAPMLMLGKEITGQTLGIIGAGRIGADLAMKMAKGFRMKILYSDLKNNEELDAIGGRKVELDDLCRESDYISIHVNYYPETHHLINEENLKLMKKDAVLVNTARGPVVDEAALIRTLQEKRIFGAGLDVFEDEPAMKPGLAELDNVIVAPHVGSATIEARTKMSTMAAQNMIDALEGREPKYVVKA